VTLKSVDYLASRCKVPSNALIPTSGQNVDTLGPNCKEIHISTNIEIGDFMLKRRKLFFLLFFCKNLLTAIHWLDMFLEVASWVSKLGLKVSILGIFFRVTAVLYRKSLVTLEFVHSDLFRHLTNTLSHVTKSPEVTFCYSVNFDPAAVVARVMWKASRKQSSYW
jgi:hypothetical protein